MKTTVELPDDLFREAKATAARKGTALKVFFREAVAEKLEKVSGVPMSGAALREPHAGYGQPIGTLGIPASLLREAEAAAADSNTSVTDYLCAALSEKLARSASTRASGEQALQWPYPPLRLPREEMENIDRAIEEAFEQIEPEDWA